MKFRLVLLASIIVITIISCSPTRNEMVDEITKMESELKSNPKVDSVAFTEMLSAYQNFASKYPDDSLAPDYLYKAAGLAVGINRGTQAIDLYERILNTYPQFEKIPECVFMEAFAYENVIGNIAKASEYYNKFLLKYPDHDLADDAQAAIKFLGKSPEEMVKEFEKMNADTVDIPAN